MGQGPSIGSGAADGAIGLLELTCCCGAVQWSSCPCCGCCRAIGSPDDTPAYRDALRGGFGDLLNEALLLVNSPAVPVCCGCCRDVHRQKAVLDEQWTARANALLKRHGLRCEVLAWHTYDNHGDHPHLGLQFFEVRTDGQTGVAKW